MKKKFKYKLVEILAQPGDKVKPGDVIGRLEVIEDKENTDV